MNEYYVDQGKFNMKSKQQSVNCRSDDDGSADDSRFIAQRIGIIGTGYVGLVTGTCFAQIGHQVICQDSDQSKIKTLNGGKLPIYESHLKELVRQNIEEGRLSFTSDSKEAIAGSDIIFICVGTPPLENGEADLSAVEDVARQIAEYSVSYKLIVEKSTVPVETGEWIKKTLQTYCKNSQADFDVASNPEFLREGRAVSDFLYPDRIVVGVENDKSRDIFYNIYSPIIHRFFVCPIHKNPPSSGTVPMVVTDIKSAELIKHASNSFLATKISFINALADICEMAGANVTEVAYGMGLDSRIGKDFLNAGIGFGGFCFPKDLQAFIRIAEKLGYDFSLLKEVERINENRVTMILSKLKEKVWVIKGKTIGILGLSFKPDTDDIRFSPSLKIIKELLREEAQVKVYDPQAMEKVKEIIPQLVFCNNPLDAAKDSEALLLATEWGEFKDMDFEKIKTVMARPLIIDGRNMFDREEMLEAGFEYQGIGM